MIEAVALSYDDALSFRRPIWLTPAFAEWLECEYFLHLCAYPPFP